MNDRKFTRREIVGKLVAGMAAGAAWPVVSPAHPLHEHFRNAALLDRADAAAAATDWRPLFLNAEQNEILASLAETIVPGSGKAQANRFIDLLLSVDTREHQEEFKESLFRVVYESRQKYKRPFVGLTASEREDLLTRVANDEELRPHFDNLKEWIVGAYYSSEEGMRELGWDGKHAFAKFPGCEHQGEEQAH